MFRLGQKVYIVTDKFEQGLPVGNYAYIIAYDRNADNAFDYVIRVPRSSKHFFVPASDLELEEVLIQFEVRRVEKEALIDYALATKNEELFRNIMNVDKGHAIEEKSPETLNQEEFVKQINLKAWI
ncbi:MAG TPA: ATPase [Bacilli bacterium]